MRKYAIFIALSCAMIIMMCGSASAASPSANFTANTTNGVGPVTVQFTDTSTGNATSWNWNFGDNGISTQQNPVHTYTALGAHNVTLTVANSDGSNSLTKTNYITVWNVSSLPNNNGIDIYVANDAGVKYDMPNGVTTSAQYGGVYPYVPNTYYIAEGGGGTNPIQLSTNASLIPGYNAPASYTNTNNQSGTFYVVFRGGILHLDDAILMIAVNGTVPADFSLTLSASGYNYTMPVPATSNPSMSSLTNITYVNSTLNETFYKSDLIYNQNWRPYNVVSGESQLINGINEYPIYYGENLTDPNNNFHLMFVDLNAAGFSPTSGLANLINNGAITVNYSFHDLQGFAAFAAYGFFSACNWGTGIPQASYNGLCGYNVQGTGPTVVTPVAGFTANTTTGTAPLNVQFTDTSSNTPTSWLWDFGDGSTSTTQNPTHKYTIAGKYNVTLTAINDAGNSSITQNNYVTVVTTIPVTSFTSNGTNGLTVQFNDTSSNSPTSWSWNFGEHNTLGNVYVADIANAAVYKIIHDGSVTTLGNGFGFSEPWGVAVDSIGNVYVTDIGNDAVYKISTKGAVTTVGSGFNQPEGVAVDSSGNLYVVDSGNAAVYKISPDGTQTTLASGSEFSGSYGVAVDLNGNVYVTSTQPALYKISPTGTLTSLDIGNGYTGPFAGPYSVAVDSIGNLYVADYNAEDVFEICTNGTIKSLGSGYNSPVGVAVDSSGNVYAADYANGEVYEITPNGTQTTLGNGFGFSCPFGVAVALPDSTLQNPSYTYSTPGTYTVTLTTTNAAGSSTTTNYINVNYPAPSANFTANTTSGLNPLSVQFTDESTGNVTSYYWDFGDGTTSTLQNPTHTYTNEGTYNVTETVTGPGGNNTQTQTNLITVNYPAPIASFTENTTSGTAPLNIQFNDQSTGTITQYNWNFGDGTNSTLQSPTHIYTTPGTYNVTETVTGPGGNNIITLPNVITVFNSTPPNVTASPDTGIYNTGQNVTLTSDQPGSTIYYTTDGSDPKTSPTSIPYSNPIPINTTTTLEYAAVNQGGVWSTRYSKTYIIDTSIPSVSVNPTGGLYNTTKTVTLTSTDADTNTTTYYTTDGTDPKTSITATVYTGPITINTTTTLRFIAVDQANNWSPEYTETYTIIHAPVAGFTTNTTSGTAPLNIQFNDQSTGTITQYNWNFGDGTTSTLQNPTHTFSDPGVYTVIETVTSLGGSDTTTMNINVKYPAVTASFTTNTTSGTVPLSIQFTDSSTNNPVSWSWIFGDGTTSTEQNPTHTYNTPGTYNVTETVTGHDSNSTITSAIIVKSPDTTKPTVKASKNGGAYNTSQSISLSMNEAGSIYYTTNGATPTATSKKYTSPINITTKTTLKFIAIDLAGNQSIVYNESYTIAPTASTSLNSGLYNTDKVVTLSMSEKGTIYYTTNGATPTTTSKKYTSPITITTTTNLKFVAIDLAGNKSPVYTNIYTIDKTTPKVVSTIPKNGATGVSTTSTITVKLSENLKAGVNWSKIYMKNLTTGKLVAIKTSLNGNEINIKMVKTRYTNNLYEVYIPTGAVKDNAGNNLKTSYILQFKTV